MVQTERGMKEDFGLLDWESGGRNIELFCKLVCKIQKLQTASFQGLFKQLASKNILKASKI